MNYTASKEKIEGNCDEVFFQNSYFCISDEASRKDSHYFIIMRLSKSWDLAARAGY